MTHPKVSSRPVFASIVPFVTRHPRLVLTIVLLVLAIAVQGTVSAETTTPLELGDPTVEPNSGHDSGTGP
ncbi:hypothetical protein [Halogranum rubrum]|uniref:hypothetical protein n=1 Tax=Halogranum rubrum TaxID=553466 RepID=UPI0012FBFAA7|nr:hypothetical protein [Halogranum salarium]